MTASGTYAFAPQTDDLLLEAWERLGKSPAALTGDVARAARRSLQYLTIDWTNRGVNLWQVDQQSFSTVIGTNAYTLAAATVEPLDVTVTVSGVERTMAAIGRDDWAAIPVKTTQTIPTQYWTERVTGTPIMHIYPAPDAVYTIQYYRLREPQDIGALANTPDAPMLWTDALASGLAARLAVKYAPDRVAGLKAEAMESYANANGDNRNRVPLRIGVTRRR